MRKALNVFLHNTMFIPGLGNLSDKLPDPHKTLVGLDMTVLDHEIVIECGLVNAPKIRFAVPKSNIKAYTFVDVPDANVAAVSKPEASKPQVKIEVKKAS